MKKYNSFVETGIDRKYVFEFGMKLIRGAIKYGNTDKGLIFIPGKISKNGKDSDGLEGVARTFLLFSFLSSGEKELRDSYEANWFVECFERIASLSANNQWVKLTEVNQAKVEAALLALGFDISRKWIWDRLSYKSKSYIINWMIPAVGNKNYPPKNWIWFKIIVQTFLSSVGSVFSIDEIKEDLEILDTYYRSDGWYSDGPERSYDYYSGWSMVLYPFLWGRMEGIKNISLERKQLDAHRLSDYVCDLIHLIGGDGAPLIQGRSLIYRFAIVSPLAAAAFLNECPLSLGIIKRAINLNLKYFTSKDIFKDDSYLSLGWFHEWTQLAQSYSGAGSPYWAGKGLLFSMLPQEHDFWSVKEEALPIEKSNQSRIIESPGWIVSGTKNDGIIRVINHGTDHSQENKEVCDSPLYSRWCYSTKTFPLLDEDSWVNPKDSSSVIIKNGNRSHRSGWKKIRPEINGTQVCVLGSYSKLKIVESIDVNQKKHGAGYTGVFRNVGNLLSISLVNNAWEVRVDYVWTYDDSSVIQYEVSGWAIVDNKAKKDIKSKTVIIRNDEIYSTIIGNIGFDKGNYLNVACASPLSELVCVPVILSERPEGLHVSSICLSGEEKQLNNIPYIELEKGESGSILSVMWDNNHENISYLNLQKYIECFS